MVLALGAATELGTAETAMVSAVQVSAALVSAAMESEVGSATASEVEMALATVSAEMVSGLVDLRQSRFWLLLVVSALVLEAPVWEALVLEALVLEAQEALVVAKVATASAVQDLVVQDSEVQDSETATASETASEMATASAATEASAVREVSVENPDQQQSQSSLHPMDHSVPDLVKALATGLVDRALETTATAWVDQVPELMIAEAAWAAATASDLAVQAAWAVASAETDSAATVLAVLETARAVPSSRPSLLSPFREEGLALGRLRVQETRVWPMQRSRLTLRHTSRSPQLLMDEAHHLTWPLLSRLRQCSECTLHCRPFSESDRHHPLPTDNSFSPTTSESPRCHFDHLLFLVGSHFLHHNTTLARRMGWLGCFILRILWKGDQGVSE